MSSASFRVRTAQCAPSSSRRPLGVIALWSVLALLGGGAASAASADDRLFEVIPPWALAFNYPDPPREGAAGYFPIAEKGRAKCVIVQPAAASRTLQRAVNALQTYLNLVTGARIEVFPDDRPVPRSKGAIHVGDTVVALKAELGLPELDYGGDRFPNLNGYLVRTVDRRTLIIRGPNDEATAHGVVGFLKRYVGVRQYWPGPPGGLGDALPQRPSLAMPDVIWRDWPYLLSATFSTKPFVPCPSGIRVDFYRRHETLPCNESYHRWLPPTEYAQTHPEYYSLFNGRRLVPDPTRGAFGWQPCVSNPEVARLMGERVTQYFRENPEALGINFAINDGGRDCECPNCRALDPPPSVNSSGGGGSDRYVKLSNEVCEAVGREFPSKRIVYLAYGGARLAPRTVQPHAMLLPVVTVPGNMFQAWDEWLKTGARHLGLYLHHDDAFFVLPKLDLEQCVRRLRYALGSNRMRVFYLEMHAQWPFGDVIPYVMSELLWDPRLEVAALLDDYYAGFFGSAGAWMRKFHAVIERGYEDWLAANGESHGFGRDVTSLRDSGTIEQFRVLSPASAAQADAILAEAAAAAMADATVFERIRLIQQSFQLQEMGVRWAWAAFRLRESPVRSIADARRVVADARTVYGLSAAARDYIQNTLEQPPLEPYSLFRRSNRRNVVYEEMKSGRPGPEFVGAIGAGVRAAADFLREELGPARAAAWWRDEREREPEPALAAAFHAAELSTRQVPLKNLVRNPGFEDLRAAQLEEGSEADRNTDRAVPVSEFARLGVRNWFPERTPYQYVLTSEAHSGRHALAIEHAYRVRFSRQAAAQPGELYRVSVWFKHNEGAGQYRFAVDARLADSTYPVLASLPIAHRPGEWRELSADVTVPPEATAIMLRLYVAEQAADARCWIDDAFIGKYPD